MEAVEQIAEAEEVRRAGLGGTVGHAAGGGPGLSDGRVQDAGRPRGLVGGNSGMGQPSSGHDFD